MSAEDEKTRTINVLSEGESTFASNVMKTTKYSLIPFFPTFFLWRMLYEQFQRKANIYFLIIGCLQTVPGISPTGQFTTLSTLVSVLIFSFIKSGYEDFQRYKKDNEINNRTIFVLKKNQSGSAQWTEIKYTDIKVGDIIRVTNIADAAGDRQHDIPCDIFLLMSEDAEGVCYVETSNLDGETNLKPKRCLDITRIATGQVVELDNPNADLGASASYTASGSGGAFVEIPADPLAATEEVAADVYERFANAKVECELPNGNLYSFTGLYSPKNPDGTLGEPVSITPNQMLYRGCNLRKVPWIIGLVIFTGKETKVMMNAKKPPHKASRVEVMVNRLLISILTVQLVMCVSCAVGLAVQDNTSWYLKDDSSAAYRGFIGFLTFLILFNNLIPISLYVSLEVVKFLQGRWMEQDLCMYYDVKDMPALAKSTDLNEELGQVNFVFSDKTGTLTCNVMSFMKFCVNGVVFGMGTTEIGRAAAKRKGVEVYDPRPEEVVASNFPFFDPRITDDHWLSLEEKESELVRKLLVMLAVCHTVVIDGGKFEAESPDEEALVRAAQKFNFNMVKRTNDKIYLHVGNAQQHEVYRVLEVIPFNSDRKRMSIIVKTPEDEFKLMMKGADNVIFARLVPEEKFVQETELALQGFGDDGLRTLVLCEKTLSEGDLTDWLNRYRAAKLIMGDDEEKEKQLSALGEEIEQNMHLVGCTAIEDKLQKGVPETIDALRRGGMKVWMLTGDKMETAINIGFACALLHNNMDIVTLSKMDAPELREKLQNLPAGEELAAVVDGHTLAVALEDPELADLLYNLTSQCSSVVCCRVSPKQKAMVVDMVRSRAKDAVTLGIGDGANDVPMIQSAHVGVGISGMEGQQAANAADYAIGQFRFLHRLTMIHGRACYFRLCLVINYFFYKNAFLVLTQFLFCFFNRFTGQSLYEQWTLVGYNVGFTALPVLVVGILDRDILNTDHIHVYPKVYEPGHKNQYLNTFVFLQWIGNAFLHAVCCFFAIMFGWYYTIGLEGMPIELDGIGIVIYSTMICAATFKLALHTQSFTWIHHLLYWGTILFYFAYLAVYGQIIPTISTTMYKIMQNVGFQLAPWMMLLVVLFITLTRDFVWRYIRFRLIPISMLPIVRILQFKDETDAFAATRPPKEVRGRSKDVYTSDMLGQAQMGELFSEYTGDDEVLNPSQNILLQFVDQELEDEFIDEHIGDLNRYKLGTGICALASLVLVGSTAVQHETVDPVEIYAWAVFSASAIICFLLFVAIKAIKPYTHPVMIVMMIIGFSALAIANLKASSREPTTQMVTLAILLLGLLTVIRPPLMHSLQYVIIAFVCVVAWYQLFRVKEWQIRDFSARFVEVAMVAITALIALASAELFLRRMFISQKQVKRTHAKAQKEEARSLRLLGNVLPEPIVLEVRENKKQLAGFSVTYEEASLLNSDIVKFTNFSSTKEPHVVVEMLNRMFTKFDACALELGLEKIKTIGDAYICAAGIPIPEPLHHKKIVLMGLRMVDCIHELNREGLSSLRELNIQIRIGTATGAVRAGVIGMQKVCYDVFGHTAEQSEKMEQTGLPDRVQCSPELHALNVTEFEFETVVRDGREGYFVLSHTKEEVKQATESVTNEDEELRRTEDPPRSVPYVSIEHKDIYAFLEDSDEDRLFILQTWAEFEGERSLITLSFVDEFAEADFRVYYANLAATREVTEMSSGSYLFLVTALLLALWFSDGVSHPMVIVLIVLGVFHLVAAIILGILQYLEKRRNQKKKKEAGQAGDEDDDEEDQHGEEPVADASITGTTMRRKSRVRSVVSIAESTDQPTVVVSNEEPEGIDDSLYDEVPLCSRSRALASISGLLAFITPLLIFPSFNDQEVGTISVFVTLGVAVYMLTFMHMRIPFKIVLAILHFICVSAVFVSYQYVKYEFSAGSDGGDYFAIFLCYILSYLAAYNMESSVRKNYVAAKNVVYRNAEVNSAVDLCEKLLNNVLPRSIVTRMKKAPGEQIVDQVDDASVLFVYTDGLYTDDTDQTAETVTMVDKLNDFLVIIDELCVRHKVEKIKTAPFLVVSGCPEPVSDHCERIALLARDVQESVKSYNERMGSNIRTRMGIHSGKVTAGVLGTSKFLYDVFGDTVNFASRLTSSAQFGTIQLSVAAKNRLEGIYEFESRGTVELKGKGPQEVFVLATDKGALTKVEVPSLPDFQQRRRSSRRLSLDAEDLVETTSGGQGSGRFQSGGNSSRFSSDEKGKKDSPHPVRRIASKRRVGAAGKSPRKSAEGPGLLTVPSPAKTTSPSSSDSPTKN